LTVDEDGEIFSEAGINIATVKEDDTQEEKTERSMNMEKTVDYIMKALDTEELEMAEKDIGLDFQGTLENIESHVKDDIQRAKSYDTYEESYDNYVYSISDEDTEKIIENTQKWINEQAHDMKHNFVEFHDGAREVVTEGYRAEWFDTGKKNPELDGFCWELYFDKDEKFTGVFIGQLSEMQRRYVEDFFDPDFTDLDLGEYDIVEEL